MPEEVKEEVIKNS